MGVEGPFPRISLSDPLERRWLHYALIGAVGQALIANIAWLEGGFSSAILLLHDRDRGWRTSQWNARRGASPWSAFRAGGGDTRLGISAAKGWPAVDTALRRTSTPSISGCATFHQRHFMRWQAEPGILATGEWRFGEGDGEPVRAVGYHERVRGRWGWPELGGWVFGFCNAATDDDTAPAWSIVFALMQPDCEIESQVASLMLWRRGRLVRHIPRRAVRVSAAGQLDRDRVVLAPFQSHLFGVPAMAPIPSALWIEGWQGADWVRLRFRARDAARLVVPSETSERPFSVHEVVGEMEVEITLNGARYQLVAPGIVEFAGGAASGGWDVH
jgi:hypothetical protein